MDTKELKETVEDAKKALHDLRDMEEKRVAELDKKFNTQDALLQEYKTKVNERIDQLVEQAKKAEDEAKSAITALNRPGMGGAAGTDFEVKSEDLAAFRVMTGNGEAGAKEYMEQKAAMESYMRRGDEAKIAEMQQKAMSVDSDPNGGYFVMPDTSGRIIEFIRESSPMRQYAAVQPISTDSLEGTYDLDEADAGWVGERAGRPSTGTPNVGRWKIPVFEQFANPAASQKLIDDSSVNIMEWLAGKSRRKFSRMEATGFVTGDGVEKPRGFLTYPEGTPDPSDMSTYKRIQVRNTGANGDFAASDPADALINLVGDLKGEYRNGSIFAMNRTTMAKVRTLKTGADDYALQMDFRQGLSQTILGYEAAEFNDMPDIATNSLSIAFGNFAEGYQIVDRVGVRVLRDPFSAKPNVQFYTTRRVGGDVVNFDAIKLLKFAS